MEFHPTANLFPLMQGIEFDELCQDIEANGLLEPIWLHHDGRIIDGRNRYNACVKVGVEPSYRTWGGKGSLVGFVVSLNLHRRHLTSGQRAALGARLEPIFAEEAKDRQILTATRNSLQGNVSLKAKTDKGQARDQAAQATGTSGRSVSDAKRIQRDAPNVFEMLETGEIPTVAEAKRKAFKKEKPAREIPPQAIEAMTGKTPRLYVGRAENMSELDSDSVDIIITSPPYNLGEANWPMGGNGRIPRETGIGYDTHSDKMREDEYQKWQIQCLIEMYRVAKPGASLFYNHKVRNRDNRAIFPHQWLLNNLNPWVVRQEIWWDRTSTHNHNPGYFYPEDERIFWLFKGDKPNLYNDSIGMSTIWRFHGPRPNTSHPAPFDDELPRRCLQAIGGQELVVLDPFSGSCTTLRVALSEFNHAAIGYDVSIDYLRRAILENKWALSI